MAVSEQQCINIVHSY